jgi:hypothetical protein
MIYSQRFLMDQGLAVTWDNPDIHLERNGVPVSSSELRTGTAYDVVARVWNTSREAPAIALPVHFASLSFGIGAARTPIGTTTVDVPVLGAAGLPVLARVEWNTPDTAGHYCIQVELEWPDDANLANNLGQENTDVLPLNSPRAQFRFPVRNDAPQPRTLELVVDSYAIPPLPRCGPDRPPARRHALDGFAVPDDWHVTVTPATLRLQAGEARNVTVDVIAPDDFTGRKAFNVNAFTPQGLAGGVTLYVEEGA